jgi:hypothetical protein
VSLTAVKHIETVNGFGARLLGPAAAGQEEHREGGNDPADFCHWATSKFQTRSGFW